MEKKIAGKKRGAPEKLLWELSNNVTRNASISNNIDLKKNKILKKKNQLTSTVVWWITIEKIVVHVLLIFSHSKFINYFLQSEKKTKQSSLSVKYIKKSYVFNQINS